MRMPEGDYPIQQTDPKKFKIYCSVCGNESEYSRNALENRKCRVRSCGASMSEADYESGKKYFELKSTLRGRTTEPPPDR